MVTTAHALIALPLPPSPPVMFRWRQASAAERCSAAQLSDLSSCTTRQEEEKGRAEAGAAVRGSDPRRPAVCRLLRRRWPAGVQHLRPYMEVRTSAVTAVIALRICGRDADNACQRMRLWSLLSQRHISKLSHCLPRQGNASYWKRNAVDTKRKLDDLNNLHSQLRVRAVCWTPNAQSSVEPAFKPAVQPASTRAAVRCHVAD